MSTYYDKEFKQLADLSATLKLQNEQGQTRWMTVSPEQVAAILAILKQTDKVQA